MSEYIRILWPIIVYQSFQFLYASIFYTFYKSKWYSYWLFIYYIKIWSFFHPLYSVIQLARIVISFTSYSSCLLSKLRTCLLEYWPVVNENAHIYWRKENHPRLAKPQFQLNERLSERLTQYSSDCYRL